MEGRKRVSMGVKGVLPGGGRSRASPRLINITHEPLETFHKRITKL